MLGECHASEATPVLSGGTCELRCTLFEKTSDFICNDGTWTTPYCNPFKVVSGDCHTDGICVKSGSSTAPELLGAPPGSPPRNCWVEMLTPFIVGPSWRGDSHQDARVAAETFRVPPGEAALEHWHGKFLAPKGQPVAYDQRPRPTLFDRIEDQRNSI